VTTQGDRGDVLVSASEKQTRFEASLVEAREKREKRRPGRRPQAGLKRTPSKLAKSPLGHCTPAQRERVRGKPCLCCGGSAYVDPAHLIDRGTAPSAADNPRAVVPLCRWCHQSFDDGDLDLSPWLEPRYREEVAWAVEAVGLFAALRRITKRRWQLSDEGWSA
jgi:hypothetical protein